MVALLVATSATLSACAGHSDRAADSSQAVAAGAKQIQTEYVPCGKPSVKLEKSTRTSSTRSRQPAAPRCTSSRTRTPGKC